jgi:26S proteasome non-ATPase regulatory subunit 10
MDSGYAEVAVLLIDKGADRTRVSVPSCDVFQFGSIHLSSCSQENLDGETPESVPGVGGREQHLARQYVINHCGP